MIANRHGVELDGIQVLTKLVVKLAREMLALGFLHEQVALRELAILRECARETRLCPLPRGKLTARAAVAPLREPDKTERQCDESHRQLIELQWHLPRPS